MRSKRQKQSYHLCQERGPFIHSNMRKTRIPGAGSLEVEVREEKGILCLMSASLFLVKYKTRSREKEHRCMKFEKRGKN